MVCVLETATSCEMSAEEFWALHKDLDCERYVARVGDGKTIELLSEERSVGADGIETTTRTVKMGFTKDPVPAALSKFISADDVVPVVTCTWFASLYDKAHPCQMRVEMPGLGDRVTISGVQWAEPISEHTCKITTRIEIQVRMFGVGGAPL